MRRCFKRSHNFTFPDYNFVCDFLASGDATCSANFTFLVWICVVIFGEYKV